MLKFKGVCFVSPNQFLPGHNRRTVIVAGKHKPRASTPAAESIRIIVEQHKLTLHIDIYNYIYTVNLHTPIKSPNGSRLHCMRDTVADGAWTFSDTCMLTVLRLLRATWDEDHVEHVMNWLQRLHQF